MKVAVKNLQNKEVGNIDLDDSVFGVEVRKDLLHRVVVYQLAKRRGGNHKTKGISEISGTGKKPWAQKGTGRARAGSIRRPQDRGGAVIFGPVVRSHAIDVPKKLRQHALKCALSSKIADGKVIVLDEAKSKDHKTKTMAIALKDLGIKSAVIICGEELDANFARAVNNIPNIDVLPVQGANVYDILRRDVLVITKEAIEKLVGRLSSTSNTKAA